ncbi:MAG: histidine kinase dimerization/phosphoacceptor domain -containing protein [Dongiaceae bacterium]
MSAVPHRPKSGAWRIIDSLRRRLIVLLGIILLLPTALSVILAINAYREQSGRARAQVQQYAELASAFEEDFFADTRRLLQSYAAGLRGLGSGDCSRRLGAMVAAYPEYADVALLDGAGRVTCSPDSAALGVSFAEQTWFRRLAADPGFVIGDFAVGKVSHVPIVVAAQALDPGARPLSGAIAVAIKLDWLGSVGRGSRFPGDGVVYVLDSAGVAMSGLGGDAPDAGLPSPAMLRQAAHQRIGEFEARDRSGNRRVYSAVPLANSSLVLLLGLPAAGTIDWVTHDLVYRLLVLAAIWAAVILTAWIAADQLVGRWIAVLNRAANAFSRGRSFGLDLGRAPAELRQLGDSFGAMAAQVRMRESELRQSLAQKDILLREIHHRVKNNLQLITSLLNLHARTLGPSPGRRAIGEVQTRIRALALVHRHLYQNDDLQLVELQPLLIELCEMLQGASAVSSERVRVSVEIGREAVAAEKAVPIALLVTEAITNAFEHAFPGDRSGRIAISVRRLDEPGVALLSIADDGIGMPSDAGAAPGIGLALIAALARQAGGAAARSGPPGTTLSLQLRLAPGTDAGDRH